MRLIDELLQYNKEGNFDLISAFFMCMFQVEEEVLGKEYTESKGNKNANKLLGMMKNMYRNSSLY